MDAALFAAGFFGLQRTFLALQDGILKKIGTFRAELQRLVAAGHGHRLAPAVAVTGAPDLGKPADHPDILCHLPSHRLHAVILPDNCRERHDAGQKSDNLFTMYA